MLRTVVRAALLVWLAAAAAPIGAQRPDTSRIGADRDSVASRLPAVHVLGSILRPAGPAVGTGLPARTAVIGGDALAAWRPRLLTDALVREPGMTLYDDLGSAAKPTLVARGFTASPVVGLPQGVSVFVDGVPVNEPDAGQVNFDLLPLNHLERIEVLSGTASLLGPHSLGGAVNLITRHAGEDAHGAIELSAGSHDAWSANASYGASAESWSWYAGGSASREEGWRQLTGGRHHDAFLNLSRAGPAAAARLQAFAAAGYAETAGSLPLSVFRVRPDSNLSAGDFEDLTQLHVALSGHAPLGAGVGTATLYVRSTDAERFNVNQEDDPDVRSFSANRSLGASADWSGDRSAGPGTLGMRAGFGASVHRSTVRIFAERLNPGLTTSVESPIGRFDAFALAQYGVGPLTLSGGARYDRVRLPFRNRLNPARDTTSTFARLSPHGGMTVALGGHASAYVSAGRSFRAPALIELACADPERPCPLPFALGDDPPLDPVVATTWEGGARWFGPWLALSVSAYRTNVRDDIFLFPYGDDAEPAGSTIDGYFANIARTRREGLELGSRFFRGAVALHAQYAFTRATFQVSDVEIFSIRAEAGGENRVARGDRLPLVPEHVVSVGGAIELPGGFDVGMDARYTGERPLRGDETNDEPPLGAYWITDARLGYRLASWSVQAIVRNVFDDAHATFGTFNINQGAGDVLERFLTPGAPRTLQVVVRRQLGGGD